MLQQNFVHAQLFGDLADLQVHFPSSFQKKVTSALRRVTGSEQYMCPPKKHLMSFLPAGTKIERESRGVIVKKR